ncbi:MAG: hypothetical protein FWD06_04900 [Oscillospiraceae bacterium]|nr:hypothetical protein [Oscillospiraceae bacterium]
MSNKKERRPIISPQLWHNKRFAAAISLILAVVVWVMFAVVGGEDQERIITGVPVIFTLENLPATPTAQHLQAFWQTAEDNPHQLTIDVTVRAARNEVINADDIEAIVFLGGVFQSGPASLEIRVATANERVRIVSFTPEHTPWLYFDLPSTEFFNLTLDISGGVVEEGYFAAEPFLLQPTVQVSGPQGMVQRIDAVYARFEHDLNLIETTRFDDAYLVAYDQNGMRLGYLTFNGGQPEISAVLPVWPIAQMDVGVMFAGIPSAAQPSFRITPNRVNAAAANMSDENGTFIIGQIHAHELSPANNRFRFAAAEIPEVHFFTQVDYFDVEVDLQGYDMTTFMLPAAQIRLPDGSPFTAAFGSAAGITIVGPEAILSEMTAQDITAMALLNDELAPGTHRLPLHISTRQGDTWAFGEHFVTAQLIAVNS